MQFFEDRVCSGSPLERLAIGVVGGNEVIDALNALHDAGEGSAADGLVGDQQEESFDLVQPRTVGRDEVHVPARFVGKPGLALPCPIEMWVHAAQGASAVQVLLLGPAACGRTA